MLVTPLCENSLSCTFCMHFSVHIGSFKQQIPHTKKVKTQVQRCPSNVHLGLSFLEMFTLPHLSIHLGGPFPVTHHRSPFVLLKRQSEVLKVCSYWPSSLLLTVPQVQPEQQGQRDFQKGPRVLWQFYCSWSPFPHPVRLLLCVFYPLGVLVNMKNKLFGVRYFLL